MIPNKYPFTNFHELNLDWILKEMQDLETKFDTELVEQIRAVVSTLIIQDTYDAGTETLTIELVLP